jgi:hypothetical protein
MWIEEMPISHKTPQVALIISREVQTGETWKRTNNLQQNMRDERYIENANSHVEFRPKKLGI